MARGVVTVAAILAEIAFDRAAGSHRGDPMALAKLDEGGA
jgi:hypothetical protein